MAKYTVRVTEEAGNFIAWIDQDNKICIRQENEPGVETKFASAAEAQTWGDAHAAELEAGYELAVVRTAEAAAQATKLDEIHAMLTALSK
jgi:hypothetical protein